MATHTHPHTHLSISDFLLSHPYATQWAMVAAIGLAAVLLWFWNS